MGGSLFQKWFWSVATCAATSAAILPWNGQALAPSCAAWQALAPFCAERLPGIAVPPSPARPPGMVVPPSLGRKRTHPSCVFHTSTRPELSAALNPLSVLLPENSGSSCHPTSRNTRSTPAHTPKQERRAPSHWKPSLITQHRHAERKRVEDGVRGSEILSPPIREDHHGRCLP